MKLLDIELSEKQAEQFKNYYDLLIEWNSKINLTAITDYNEVLVKHFEDSISIMNILDMNSVDSVIDIGTGAGFPGIPIKIMFPHIKLTLLDSLNKRINFLNLVIEELGLDNVKTIHGRAEDYAKDAEYRENYDLVVSRAVANLSTLSEFCLPFAKIGGLFVSYKAEKANEELNIASKAISILGGANVKCNNISLSTSDYSRNLIVISKEKHTPGKYPRKAGMPLKSPIV